MKKEKVLILSFEFPPKVGGAGNVGFDYATFLSKAGYDVTVISLEAKSKRNFKDFKVVSVRSPRKIHPLLVYRAFLKVYDKSFKTIILNDAGANITASLFFNREKRNKSIVFVHGTEDEKLINNRSFLFKVLQIREKYNNLLYQCKGIVAVGQHLKTKFIAASGLEFLNSKIQIIPNNVSMPSQDLYNSEFKNIRDLFHHDSIILLTASRLVEGKGYVRMLNLFAKILESEPKYRWVIAGDGNFENTIHTQIISLGLVDKVKLIGSVNKLELFSYYKNVDLFWMLSDFDEGYPLVYMEAALNGCPGMGNNKGGVKEVISSQTGYLVNNDEEVLEILKNKDFMNLNKEEVAREAQLMNKDLRSEILNLINLKEI